METYAPRCDRFLAASNQTNVTLGAASVLHAGPEEMYGNFWQKVRSIWTYVHKHYRNGFDCFHIDEFDESRYHPLTVEYHATRKRRNRAPWFPVVLEDAHRITATLREGFQDIRPRLLVFI